MGTRDSRVDAYIENAPRNGKYERRAAPSLGRKPATRRPTAEVAR
jgi:hypothetical protein